MSDNATLKAQKREGKGKGAARKLRQAGRVPAVLYGRDMEPLHLSVDAHDTELLFRSISVDNTIVDVDIEGDKGAYPTLVREVQAHPWKGTLVHIDFLRIQKGVAVDLEIPLHLVGIPEGVRTGGGTLEQVVHELPVRCIPSKIPESFELDVTALEVGESLHVSDIPLEEGIEIRTELDRTVCAVAAPRGAGAEEGEEGGEDLSAAGADEAGGDAD